MTFEKVVTDLLEEFRGRARYRIVSSFAMSFVMWNWYDVSVLIFDDAPFWLKAKMLRLELTTLNWLVVPLAFALGWMYVVPLINYCTEWLRLKFIDGIEEKIRKTETMNRNSQLRAKIKALKVELFDLSQQLDEEREKAESVTNAVQENQKFLLRRFNLYVANRTKMVRFVADAERMAKRNPLLSTKVDYGTALESVLNDLLEIFEEFATIPIAYLESDSVQVLREIKDCVDELKENKVIFLQSWDHVAVENVRLDLLTKLNRLGETLDSFKPHITIEQLKNSRNEEVEEEVET